MSESGHIICEGDVVLPSSFRFDRSWSPQVGVDLVTKFCGMLALMSLWDGFSSRFCIHAQLAKIVS